MSTADRSPDLAGPTHPVHPTQPPQPTHAGRTTARGILGRITDADAAATIGVGGIAVAALLPADHIENGPVLCIFRRLTGLPCPGCGLTRSWVYLMHGDLSQAFISNPFGPVLVVAVIALAIAVVRARVRHERPPRLEAIARARPVQAVFAAWLLFGLIRLLYVALG